jgi:hypothetical protein
VAASENEGGADPARGDEGGAIVAAESGASYAAGGIETGGPAKGGTVPAGTDTGGTDIGGTDVGGSEAGGSVGWSSSTAGGVDGVPPTGGIELACSSTAADRM